MATDRDTQNSQDTQAISGAGGASEYVGSTYTDLNLSNFNFEAAGQRLGDVVAAMTETPKEAQIDAANGLRGSIGRRPVAADFDGLLTEGNGDILGPEVSDTPFMFGETGSTRVPDDEDLTRA